MQHCLPYTILAMQVDLISQLCSGTQTASCTYFYQHILAQRMPQQNFRFVQPMFRNITSICLARLNGSKVLHAKPFLTHNEARLFVTAGAIQLPT